MRSVVRSMTGGRRASVAELMVVYLMALTAFSYFVGTWQDGNTLSRLSLVKSLAEEHRFEIDTTQLSDELREYRHEGSVVLQRTLLLRQGHRLLAHRRHGLGADLQRAAGGQRAFEQRFFKATAAFLGVSAICAALAPIIYGFVTAVGGGRTHCSSPSRSYSGRRYSGTAPATTAMCRPGSTFSPHP